MEESKKERSEQRAVEYLKGQIDYSQPKAVMAIYTQLIEQNIFETRVGLSFLTGLKKYLIDHGMIEEEKKLKVEGRAEEPSDAKAKPAPKKEEDAEKSAEEEEKPAPKRETKKTSKQKKTTVPPVDNPYRKRFFYSLFINFVLVIVVILMFVITLTSDNPTIINYKQKIEDEYASWEQDLDNREKALNSWERDLNDRENSEDEE